METRILEQTDTPFGRIAVCDTTVESGETIRTLLVNGEAESAVSLSPDHADELQFHYMETFSFAFSVRPRIRKVLMIGGGGFAYPRYFLHRFADGTFTAAEISPDIVRFARKYFGLEKLEQDRRFRLIEGDGFKWLACSSERFDLIINDAFLGRKAIGRTESDTECVAGHLTEGGVYLINTLTAVTGLRAAAGRRLVSQVQHALPFVQMVAVNQDQDWYEPRDVQNCLLVASNRPV